MNVLKMRGGAAYLIPLIMLLAGLYLMPLAIFGPDFNYIPGDMGDARFNNYVLEHGYKWITGQVKTLWDAPFMYPAKNVIAYSDNLLGTMPFYAFFRALGSTRETAFQLWLLTIFILNYSCCWYALNKWVRQPVIAACGAYVFAFSIFVLAHLNTVQMFPRFMVPLVIYWTWEWMSRGSLRYFILAVAGTVYQFYCGMYLGFFLVYALFFLIIAFTAIYRNINFFRRFLNWKYSASVIAAVAGGFALLLPLALPYVRITGTLTERSYLDTINTIPTLQSYFFTSQAPVLWGFLSGHGRSISPEWWCHELFIGVLPWLAVLLVPVAFFVSKPDPADKKKLYAGVLALFLSMLFCLKIGDFSLYRWVFEIPGFSSMRGIHRVINTQIIFYVLILVFVMDVMLRNIRVRAMLLWIIPALIIADNLFDIQPLVRYSKAESVASINRIAETIAEQSGPNPAAIAYMPLLRGEQQFKTHLDVMLASQQLNIPCVNAYTGHLPHDFVEFAVHMDKPNLDRWIAANAAETSGIREVNEVGLVVATELIQLKAPNGKFLCSDPNTEYRLAANRDVASTWETFKVLTYTNGRQIIAADGNRCLTAEGTRGYLQALLQLPQTNITIEWLGRNYAALRNSSGKYFSFDPETLMLSATANEPGERETFLITRLP